MRVYLFRGQLNEQEYYGVCDERSGAKLIAWSGHSNWKYQGDVDWELHKEEAQNMAKKGFQVHPVRGAGMGMGEGPGEDRPPTIMERLFGPKTKA